MNHSLSSATVTHHRTWSAGMSSCYPVSQPIVNIDYLSQPCFNNCEPYLAILTTCIHHFFPWLSPVLWKDPSGETDRSSEPHTDFSIHITKKIFEDDWSAFISTSRIEIPRLIYTLHKDLNAETCPFFVWRKLDAETHRASFRAPSKHEKLFLKASGILGPCFIQKLCRSDDQKMLRAQETVAQWLPKRSYAQALALVHSFESRLGLVFGNGNYGIRVTTADVAQAWNFFAVCDPFFADTNRSIVGRRTFGIFGAQSNCYSPIFKRSVIQH